MPKDVNMNRNRYRCTNLVKRKGNYKECLLCQGIFKNMLSHIQEYHKINKEDEQYNPLVTGCEVIPTCCIKQEGNNVIKMTVDEMKEVESTHGETVRQQKETNQKLREKMTEIATLKALINSTEDEQDKSTLTNTLNSLQAEYKETRYMDLRNYPTVVKKWKDYFSKYQKNTRQNSNAEKISRAAIDILLNYLDTSKCTNIDVDVLLDGKILNEMLLLFNDRSDLGVETKLKYLTYYKSFLDFTCRSPLSSECVNAQSYENVLYRSAKMTELEKIIDDFKKGLISSNKQGKAKKLQKKPSKVLSSAELAEIELIKNDINKIITDNSNNVVESYTMKECITARNALMAAAANRVPRRSLELTKMEIGEYNMAKRLEIEGEVFHIIYVLEHKTNCSGAPAPIVFSELEYRALNVYMNKIRVQFTEIKT